MTKATVDIPIFWWDSGEEKIFWLFGDPEGCTEYPWVWGSADAKRCYFDFIQLDLTAVKSVPSPVGRGDRAIERMIASVAIDYAKGALDDPDVIVRTSALKVKHLSHLSRIKHEFDAESLKHTGSGRAFMAMLLAESIEEKANANT